MSLSELHPAPNLEATKIVPREYPLAPPKAWQTGNCIIAGPPLAAMTINSRNLSCSSPQGVALDDLVYICTKLAREIDEEGVEKIFDAAQAATAVLEDSRPMLQQVRG